jgi:hypothetical protein
MKRKTAVFLAVILVASAWSLIFAQSVSRTNFSGVMDSGARADDENIAFLGLTGGLGIKAGPIAFDVALLYGAGDYLDNNNAYSTSRFEEIRIYISTIISF